MNRCAALLLLLLALPVLAAPEDDPVRTSDYDLVLIHGLGGNASIWEDVIPPLRLVYNVWTFEMPGHGSTPPIKDATIDRVSVELEDYIHEHGIEFPTLVGHGMGGLVALRYAFDRPDAVNRVVLIDCAPKQLATAEQKAAVADQLVRNYDRFVAGYYLNMSPREDINQKVVDIALRTDQVTFTQMLMSSFDFDVTDELANQSVPIMLIGSAMMFPDPNLARQTMQRMGFGEARAISYKTMPEVGHYVMLEQPGYLASVLIAFSGLNR